MRFILTGKAVDVFNCLRIAAFLEVLYTWDKYETDPEWWQLKLELMCWN